MTPRAFLDQVVRPNVAALVAAYDDPRDAFNAIASIDALAGLIYEALRGRGDLTVAPLGGDDEYRNDLAARR